MPKTLPKSGLSIGESEYIPCERIPQHPLITAKQWAYILGGQITRFSYWTTYGPYHDPWEETINFPHAECVTIYSKDYK